MTRKFNEYVDCPECGHRHTAENAFKRWVRNHPQLHSMEAGIVVYDCDMLLHKFMVKKDGVGTRDIQCIMFIEVKRYMAKPTPAQLDTLSVFSSALRNRKDNMHKEKRGRHLENHHPPTKAWSKMHNKEIELRMFGAHLLQFSGSGPDDSAEILWDGKKIDTLMLIQLLRFERDPDTLSRDFLRRHHPPKNDILFRGIS